MQEAIEKLNECYSDECADTEECYTKIGDNLIRSDWGLPETAGFIEIFTPAEPTNISVTEFTSSSVWKKLKAERSVINTVNKSANFPEKLYCGIIIILEIKIYFNRFV